MSSKFRQAGPDTFWQLPNVEASRPRAGKMLKNVSNVGEMLQGSFSSFTERLWMECVPRPKHLFTSDESFETFCLGKY